MKNKIEKNGTLIDAGKLEDSTLVDPELDTALKTYALHFALAKPTPALTDEIMEQVKALRRAESGVLAADLQQFLMIVGGSPHLQSQLHGTGHPSEFVAQVVRLASERGICLKKGDVYALLRRHVAANDDALSDDQLDELAAAAAPVPFQFLQATSGIQTDTVSSASVFSWSFGNPSRRS